MDSTVGGGGAGAAAKEGLVGKRARRRATTATDSEMGLKREGRGLGELEGFWREAFGGFRKRKGFVGFFCKDGRRGFGGK